MTLPSFDHTRELMLSVTYISVQPFIFMRTLQLVQLLSCVRLFATRVGTSGQPDFKGGEGLQTEISYVADDSLSHACLRKPSRNSDTMARWSFLLGEYIGVLGGRCVSIPQRMKKLCILLFRPHPMCLFTWLVLICIL